MPINEALAIITGREIAAFMRSKPGTGSSGVLRLAGKI